MMKKLIYTLTLALFGIYAQAQVKVGANPGTIGTNSALEVEATNGEKVMVDKATGTTTIQSLSMAATTDSVVMANQAGALNQMSIGRLAQTLKSAYGVGSGNGTASVGTCPGLDYSPTGVAATAPGNASVPGTTYSATKVGSEFTAGATAGGHKYVLYVATAGLNWFQTQAFAKSVGGYLAVITSANEWNYIKANILPLPQAQGTIWIGYRKFDSPGNTTQFNWITCEQSEFNYSTWRYNTFWNVASGEPNNYNGNEGCGHINPTMNVSSRLWNDLDCNSTAYTAPNIAIIVEFNQ